MGIAVPIITTAVSGGLQALLSYIGMQKQAEETAKVQRLQLGESAADRAQRSTEFAAQYALGKAGQKLTEKQFAYKQKEDEKDRKERAEATKYNKIVTFMNGVHESLQGAAQGPMNLLGISKARAV